MQRPPLRQAKSIENVFNSAYWHLSQQDFTIAEIRSKLARKTENVEWIEQVVTQLIERNYLKSDFEFAKLYCESAFSNEIGKAAVQHKLKVRGVSSGDIDAAIQHFHQRWRSELQYQNPIREIIDVQKHNNTATIQVLTISKYNAMTIRLTIK